MDNKFDLLDKRISALESVITEVKNDLQVVFELAKETHTGVIALKSSDLIDPDFVSVSALDTEEKIRESDSKFASDENYCRNMVIID